MFFGHPPFLILIRFLEEFWRMFSKVAFDPQIVSFAYKNHITRDGVCQAVMSDL
jgi:hypothetical protein